MSKYKLIKNYPGSGIVVGKILDFTNTNEIIIENTDGFTYTYCLGDCQPNPEFWELVVEAAFTTEDMHEVHGYYTLFTVGINSLLGSRDYYIINEFIHNFKVKPNLIDYKWFYLKSNAEKYIEDNKPQFSKKDLFELTNHFYNNPFLNGIEVVNDYCKSKCKK